VKSLAFQEDQNLTFTTSGSFMYQNLTHLAFLRHRKNGEIMARNESFLAVT